MHYSVAMPTSRAEYHRARRAAQRANRPDHICEGCGAAFTPQRSDARFCTPACRAARWRPITHTAVHHHPDGYQLKRSRFGYPGPEPCVQQIGEDADGHPIYCEQPTYWLHQWSHNDSRHLVQYEHYCDEHTAAHQPDDIRIGEELQDVIARHGREDRRRYGRWVAAGEPGDN